MPQTIDSETDKLVLRAFLKEHSLLAPLLGHIFSPFLKFRGGKGLSTTFGIWLGLTLWLGPTVFGLSLFAWKKNSTMSGKLSLQEC
jgi:glycerol-3-phosphate acyltransferase PlsY